MANSDSTNTMDEQGAAGASVGVMAMHGHLQAEPKGFWHDAWSRVLQRPGAVIALVWVGIVAFFAVFSPVISNGHPILIWEIEDGVRQGFSSPMLRNMSAVDILLLLAGVGIPMWLLLPTKNLAYERVFKTVFVAGAFTALVMVLLNGLAGMLAARADDPDGTSNFAGLYETVSRGISNGRYVIGAVVFLGLALLFRSLLSGESKRSERVRVVLLLAIQAGVIAFLAELVAGRFDRPYVQDWVRQIERSEWFIPVASLLVALVCTLTAILVSAAWRYRQRLLLIIATGVMAGTIVSQWWIAPLPTFDYIERERTGQIEAVYTLIPYSPHQRQMERRLTPPGETAPPDRPLLADDDRTPFLLGTDSSGQDLLAQLLYACRLSISIGLVATGIAVTIGVTLGSLMGYFGGWVDMLLYRIVEIFMAVPVLFVLILAAAVLPKNIYVMMAIIGCFTWTNAARYTRAEFMRLREQDFVQAARALGLPMRSVLFRHMLPNGVTPVLVEASFAVAAAILFEAILSFLGYGPVDQASWGRLLAGAFDDVGDFIWWLAIFPGFAIFLTVLSLVIVGEALRDAIDPKLKKASQF